MMRPVVTAAVYGALFGVGLVISDMVNPQRVLGFLDVMGRWDPTLGFVMSGALFPMTIAWLIVRRRGRRSLLNDAVAFPKGTPVDSRLVGGAILFGIGWGLVGLCPGPALAAITLGGADVWIFLAAMLAGIVLRGVISR